MTKITIERETLELAASLIQPLTGKGDREVYDALRAALAVQPAEAGMVYPPKPPPRHCGYIPDGSGVEWNAYDTMQMEAYARMAYAAGFAAGFAAAQPAPAAVPLTDEKIDHTLATTLDEFARTTRGMSHALDVNADITANSRLRRMFARAVLAAGDKP